MDNLRRNALVSLISSYASQLATNGTNLAMKIILARLIVPADLGLYAIALMVLMAGDMLVDLGMSQHLIRERQRPYGNVILLRCSIAVSIFLGLQAFAGAFQTWNPVLPMLLRVMGSIVVIKAVSAVPNLYLDRELMIQRSLVPQLSRLLTTGLVGIGLASLHYGVWALAWGTIAGEAVFAVLITRAALGRMPVEWTLRHTGPLIRGSKFLFLIGVMGFGLQQGDIAILGGLLTAQAVGLYTMAYTLITQISKVVESAIFRVIYPVFCEFRDDLERLGKTYRQATLAITAIEAPVYFYLLFNARALVSLLLGPRWESAAVLVQALSVFGIVNPFSTFGNEVLRARQRDPVLTLSTVIGAVTLLTTGYLLTSRYGVHGMVAAHYIIIGSIPTILTVYRMLRSDFVRLSGQLAVVYASSFAAMAIASTALGQLPSAQALVAGVLVPICWYVYYRAFGDGVGSEAVRMLFVRRQSAAT